MKQSRVPHPVFPPQIWRGTFQKSRGPFGLVRILNMGAGRIFGELGGAAALPLVELRNVLIGQMTQPFHGGGFLPKCGWQKLG